VAELIDWAIITIAASSLIFAYIAYRAVTRTTRRVDSFLERVPEALTTPDSLGAAVRAAYPPADVAGIINAVVEEQKPAVVNFMATEGIPFLASIGGSDVARELQERSVLARGTSQLGSGIKGLQGLASLVAQPGKKSGIGDLMQYVPLLQQIMGPSDGGEGKVAPPRSWASQSQPALPAGQAEWKPPI
jgi:hypothetical protein